MLLPACTTEGRPLKSQSIFVGIQRARLPSHEMFRASLSTGQALHIPVRSLGNWSRIIGVVKQIRMFTDGMLVLIDSRYEGSLLKGWERAPIWIPRYGSAGVLTTWATR